MDVTTFTPMDSPHLRRLRQQIADAFGIYPDVTCENCGEGYTDHRSRHNADPTRRAVCR